MNFDTNEDGLIILHRKMKLPKIKKDKKFDWDSIKNSNEKMCIYSITNTLNGMIYIGQSERKVKSRWSDHFSPSRKSNIKKDYDKYGLSIFKFKVLHKCNSNEELDFYENFYINKLNTVHPNGYNKKSGGKSGFIVCDEIRSNHSKFMKLRFENNPELKKEMSNIAKLTHTGRKQSKEWVDKRSNSHIGFKFNNQQKINLARAHMNGKKILCSNGIIYESTYEAAIDTGAIQDHIGSICNGKRKSSNGYSFSYI